MSKRSIIGAVVGVLVALAINFLMNMVTGLMFPMTPEFGKAYLAGDMETMKALMPVNVSVVMSIGYLLATFIGGGLAKKLSKGENRPVLIVAIVFILLVVANLFMFPIHPTWFGPVGIVMAALGAVLAIQVFKKKK